MSVSRVLVLILSILFLLVMTGNFYISVSNSREFLEAHLASHAQDVATSLGLTLSSSITQKDPGSINSLVDAVFDSGYYQQIIIQLKDGSTIVERNLPIRIKGVPRWFSGFVTLDTPECKAPIMAGWQAAGQVKVKSHPGYAYAELWHNIKNMFWWFFSAWLTGTILTVVILRLLLSHLTAVEAQAEAICNREFPLLERLPWSRELRRVVIAMNTMSKKLKEIFQDQADFIESLHRKAYHDPLTGLFNRRHFESRLHHLVEGSEEFTHGALLLLQIENFKQYNQRYGHLAGDQFLKEAGAAIYKICLNDGPEHMTARLNGAEFAILASVPDEKSAENLTGKILENLSRMSSKTDWDKPFVFHCGIAWYSNCETVSQLWTEADMALRSAQQNGTTAWHLAPRNVCTPENLYTASRIRSILNHSLKHGNLLLNLEPVVTFPELDVMNYEVLARIKDDKGVTLSAQLFLNMVEQMNRMPSLDRLVVQKTFDHMYANQNIRDELAINLSVSSLLDKQFVAWLLPTLKETTDYAQRLTFELMDHACFTSLKTLKPVISDIIETSSKVSLDHFGVGQQSFGYIIDLKLSYLKIDGSYVRSVAKNRDNQFFIQAIANIAHGLSIKVIATHVENEEDFNVLKKLGVDAVQGKFVTKSDKMV